MTLIRYYKRWLLGCVCAILIYVFIFMEVTIHAPEESPRYKTNRHIVLKMGSFYIGRETRQDTPPPSLNENKSTQPVNVQPANIQPEKSPPDKTQLEKIQTVKNQFEKIQTVKNQFEKIQTVKTQPGKIQPDNTQPGKIQPVKNQFEKIQPDNTQLEKIQTVKTQPGKIQPDNTQFEQIQRVKTRFQNIQPVNNNQLKNIEPVKKTPVKSIQTIKKTQVKKIRPGKKTHLEKIQSANLNTLYHSSQTISPRNVKVEIFPEWTTSTPQDPTFIRRVYLYSAIISLHRTPPNGTEVHLVSFVDGSYDFNLTCCAKFATSDRTFSGQPATIDYHSNRGKVKIKNLRTNEWAAVGMVFSCRFPFSNEELSKNYATLSPFATCPGDAKQYLLVHLPRRKPGKVAICAKTAYGFKLDPGKLLEWFEMQRLLGVDHIQLFDLGNTEVVYKVLRYYQDMGLLELLPYKLPGRPWGRSLLARVGDFARFGNDESLPLVECRLRLAGYEYVMDVDTDEVVLPRNFSQLQPFFEQAFARHPKAASLNFRVQFFISNWGPVDPQAPLMVLRYLNSTLPRLEVSKHVYLPARTHQSSTHYVFPYPGYLRNWVLSTEATVFHYRSCKRMWHYCDGPRMTDRSMYRFKDNLLPAVNAVRRKVGLQDL